VRECAHGHLPVRPQLVRSTLTEARSDDILANDTVNSFHQTPVHNVLAFSGHSRPSGASAYIQGSAPSRRFDVGRSQARVTTELT
jgi:hypothetical protein